MKKIHFSVNSGWVVEPSKSLPPYYALVSRGKVKEIYMCFSVHNIARHGEDWVKEQLAKQREIWEELNPDLHKTLNELVKFPKYWFKDTNHVEQSYDRFIFIRFL